MCAWQRFPNNVPSTEGRHVIQDWTGFVTTDRWTSYGWSLHKPGAVVRFMELEQPPEISEEEHEKRDQLVRMCEDEAERNMKKLIGVELPKELRKYDKT